MNKRIFFFFNVLAISIVSVFFIYSCNRITSVTEPVPLVYISADLAQIEILQGVTLNAVISGVTATDISWSSSGGTLTPANGESICFTASTIPGNYTIQVQVLQGEEIITSDINLLVVAPDTTPPSTPDNVSVQPTDNCLTVYWTKNTDEDLAGYKIYYSTQSGKYTSYIDVGLVNKYTINNLENNVTYYLGVATYDNARLKNESPLSIEVSGTPQDINAPGKPLLLNITPSANTALLTWINPSDPDLQGVLVLRKRTGFSDSIYDGEIVASGNILEFSDTLVVPGVQYFYSVFTYDEMPLYSIPATKSVIIINP